MTQTYRFGAIEIRPAERVVLVDSKPVELGSRAFDVLVLLVEHRDRLVTKDELLDAVWSGLVVEENNLQVQVSALRKLLGARAIATIPGRGYRFALSEDLLPAPDTSTARRALASPRTRYAKSGDVGIAYQVIGDGPIDLVYVPGWVSNIELFWEEPSYAHFLDRLASFARLIMFDKRGTGMSDRVKDSTSLEERIDDLRAVMDAAGSRRAVLFGTSEGGPMCTLFAATRPDRVSGLVLHASFARQLHAPDYPWGRSEAFLDSVVDNIRNHWGEAFDLARRIPSRAHDEAFRERWARRMRLSATAATAASLLRMNRQIDIRDVLPAIAVPTLLLHALADQVIDIGNSRYMAGKIPRARLVELPGADHFPIGSDADLILDEVKAFVVGAHQQPEPDRVLATILSVLLPAADAADEGMAKIVQNVLAMHRGHETGTTDRGFIAAFDSPARAVRCARAIVDELRASGAEVRAGVHTGACEQFADRLQGILFEISARVAAHAAPGEVITSGTVKNLVTGSGLIFTPRGFLSLENGTGALPLFFVER